jgi:integrase
VGIVVREKVRGSGIYWVFVTWRGQRRAKRVGDRAAAEAVASQLRTRLALGDQSLLESRPTRPTPPTVTFGTVAARWLDWYPALNALRPGTLENHEKFIRVHLVPVFGSLPIGDISRRQVQEFIAARRGAGGSRKTGKALTDSTLRTRLPTLKLILDYAVEERLIPVNPMVGGPRLWRSAPPPETIVPFTGRELRAILAAAAAIDRDFAVMLRLWMQCGMRSGEVRGLEHGDLDLERGLSHVKRSRSRRRLGPTKTGRSRLVSFLHPVCEDVATWEPGATPESRSVLDGLRHLIVAPLDPAGPLFRVGGRPIDEDALYGLWRRVLTWAQVQYREPEQLRHTWASTLLSRNAPIVYVANQGGWKNAGVLLKYYAKWLPQVGPGQSGIPATHAQPQMPSIF